MTQAAPLLAIVIPTRNRQTYVVSTIRSLLGLQSDDVEIVIEDNSDTNDLEHWINTEAANARITYSYSNIRTSQTGNYERSMRGVSAEYVAFIGDDDGVNPEILDAARWAKREGFDAVVPFNKATYVWPDLAMGRRLAMAPGELRICQITGTVQQPDPEAELRKCMGDAGQNFHLLPKAYYGIVRREIMEAVRAKTGAFFPGVSPDLAAAVALAVVARKICVVDYPLFLPGASLRSNAGLGGLQKHVGALRGQPHLPADCEQKWSVVVPPFFSIQTIWAEAAVSAVVATGREDLIHQFNVPRLYAWLFMFYPRFIRLTWQTFWTALKRTERGRAVGTCFLLIHFVRLVGLRAKSLLQRISRRGPPSDIYSQKNIPDIEHAVRELQSYLQRNGWSFSANGICGGNAAVAH